jgi:hypothetical protein
MRRKGYFSEPISAKTAGPCALIAFAVVLFTYQLNKGPFNFNVYDAVVIIFASHGHLLLFPLTAFAGCILILNMAAMVGVPRVIVYMGQNTLVLMCLNGIFYHYINPPLAKWVLDNFAGSAISVTVSGVATTVVSLLLCIPFPYLFNRYVPQPPNTRIIFFSLWTFSVNLIISSWGKTGQPAPFFKFSKELSYWGYARTRLKD